MASAKTWRELKDILQDDQLNDEKGLRMVELLMGTENAPKGGLPLALGQQKEGDRERMRHKTRRSQWRVKTNTHGTTKECAKAIRLGLALRRPCTVPSSVEALSQEPRPGMLLAIPVASSSLPPFFRTENPRNAPSCLDSSESISNLGSITSITA